MKPFFSIIIPTCNRNDLLAKCLDCLAPGKQSVLFDSYEVIVTDDGNRFTSEEMIRERYYWVKWVKGPGRGPATNRNNGAKHAVGEWLVFTDDDCLPDTKWLESFFSSIFQNKDARVLEGKTICKKAISSVYEHSPVNLKGGQLWSCNFAMLNSFFYKIGKFDERFPYPHLEDVDLKYRIDKAKEKIFFCINAIVDHPPSKTPSGRKRGYYHECDIYFSLKHNQSLSLAKLIKLISIHRILTAKKYSFDLKFVFAVIEEIWIVFNNYKNWKLKYSSL